MFLLSSCSYCFILHNVISNETRQPRMSSNFRSNLTACSTSGLPAAATTTAATTPTTTTATATTARARRLGPAVQAELRQRAQRQTAAATAARRRRRRWRRRSHGGGGGFRRLCHRCRRRRRPRRTVARVADGSDPTRHVTASRPARHHQRPFAAQTVKKKQKKTKR